MQIPKLDQRVYQKVVNQALHPPFGETKPKQEKINSWDQSFKLQSIGLPQYVDSPAINKKFKIQVIFNDPKMGLRSKTVFFGLGDQYVFTNDNISRMRKLQSARYVKTRGDPLSSQYWQSMLLQAGGNFVQNVLNVMKNQVQYVWKQARNPQGVKKDYSTVVQKRNQTRLNNLKEKLKLMNSKNQNQIMRMID